LRGATTYAYDAQNRTTSVVRPNGQTIGYTYDPVGNRTGMSSPAGTLSYSYDNANRLKTVANGTGTLATYNYDAVGNRTGKMLLSSMQTDYSYDALNRLTSMVHHKGPQQPLASYTYTLGAAGNRLSVAEQDGSTISWTYDDAYRLLTETRTAAGGSGGSGGSSTPTATATNTGSGGGNGTPTFVPPSATAPSGATSTPNATATLGATNTPVGGGGGNNGLNLPWQLAWTYDAVGNRLSQTSNGSTWTYTYNNLDQMTSGGFADYTYDGRGNLATITENSAVTTYTWNARDRMTGASLPNGQSVTFAYDYAGHRTQQIANGATTNYLWDELSPYGDVIQESDGMGVPIVTYIPSGVELVAQQRSGTTQYYLLDGQGSTRIVTDNAGGVLNRYVYDAFGSIRGRNETISTTYLYTGQRFDQFTSSYYMRARSYDPKLGRFQSRDTAANAVDRTREHNRYVYVADDPINNLDPSGHWLIDVQALYKQAVETWRNSVGTFYKNVLEGTLGGLLGYGIASVWLTSYITRKILSMCDARNIGCQPQAVYDSVWSKLYKPMDLVLSGIAGGITGGLTSSDVILFLTQNSTGGLQFLIGNAARTVASQIGFSMGLASSQAAAVGLTYFMATEVSNWSTATSFESLRAAVAIGAVNAMVVIYSVTLGNTNLLASSFSRAFVNTALNVITSSWSYANTIS